jgi:hypothetical protein
MKPVILDPPANGVNLVAPKKPVILDPPANGVNLVAPKKPVAFDPPTKDVVALTAPKKPVVFSPPTAEAASQEAPKKPVVFSPPTKSGGVVLTAPKKPVVFSPPREATGWKAANAAREEVSTTTAPVVLQSTESTENSTGAALALDRDASAENSTGAALVLDTAAENSTALAPETPKTDHEIHDMIHEAHKTMCEDGRMDSPHCEKFRNTLDDMHAQIESMHDDHKSQMTEETGLEEEAAGEAAAAPDTTTSASVDYTTEVEKVTPHDPVITKHKYPYKTGPCASGATVVALLFSGLLFA